MACPFYLNKKDCIENLYMLELKSEEKKKAPPYKREAWWQKAKKNSVKGQIPLAQSRQCDWTWKRKGIINWPKAGSTPLAPQLRGVLFLHLNSHAFRKQKVLHRAERFHRFSLPSSISPPLIFLKMTPFEFHILWECPYFGLSITATIEEERNGD